MKNTSSREGDEVVQLYIGGGSDENAEIRNLRGFQRIHLKAGESRQVKFTVATADVPKSKADVSVGGGQPLPNTPHVTGTL